MQNKAPEDKKPGAVHAGHRTRLRERFLREGLDGFEAHEALELLLFYAIPQRDTNVLAHRLLSQFGSLSAVLEADVEVLCKVDGIGRNTATLLHMVPALTRLYLADIEQEAVTLTSAEQILDFLRPKFIGRTKEMMYLLCLNDKGNMVFGDFLFEGGFSSVSIYVREIIERTLRHQARGVILAHNHPGGIALPSREDVMATAAVFKALQTVDIRLYDHLIFAGVDGISMLSAGYFERFQ